MKRTVIVFLFLLCIKGNAQTLRNEVVAIGDAWFWDFQHQNRKYKPVIIKNNYYLPFKENELLETDGTAANSRMLTSFSGKGDIIDMAATENFLYVLIKGSPKNNLFDIYYIYRVTPEKNEAVQLTNAYSTEPFTLNPPKNELPSFKIQADANKVILYWEDKFGQSLHVAHDNDISPMMHTAKIAIDRKGISMENYFKPLAFVNDNLFMYGGDAVLAQYEFKPVFTGKAEKYYVIKNQFDVSGNNMRLVQMIKGDKESLYVLLDQKNTNARSVYMMSDGQLKWLADVDSKVWALISNQGNLYAKSERELYQVDTKNGKVQLLIKEDLSFGYLDLAHDHFWFQGDNIFYNRLIEGAGGLKIAQYKMYNRLTKKSEVIYNNSINAVYEDEVSTKYLLHILGDYFFTITKERANCALEVRNIYDDKKILPLPMPVFNGNMLDNGETDVYGNFVQVGSKIFYWAGPYSFRRKDGKKNIKVNERVIGCISLY